MNIENRQKIQALVKSVGAELEGKLPPHPGLQKRNPWAHLWERIQAKMGQSYKECDDSQFEEIVDVINKERAKYVQEAPKVPSNSPTSLD